MTKSLKGGGHLPAEVRALKRAHRENLRLFACDLAAQLVTEEDAPKLGEDYKPRLPQQRN